MSRTLPLTAFALSAFLSACSGGPRVEASTGSTGTSGGAATTTGAGVGAVSTLTSFLVGGNCSGAPSSLAIDFSGNLLTVAGMLLLVQPDGGTTAILPGVLGVTTVATSSSGTYITEGMPVALYSEQSFNQKYLSGGSMGCADGMGGLDGGVGFASGRAIAADAEANVYVADWSQSEGGCTRIRKVDFMGNSSTIAGNTGAQGYMNGAAASSLFWEPTGIAVDRLRNVYVSDSLNNRIRVITPAGIVSTVAGNGTAAFDDGDGPPDTPSSATFNLPTGIAVDLSGNLFIADTNNNAIRMITPDGGTTTLAGNGKPGFVNGPLGKDGGTQFNYPIGIAVDSKDNVYVADYGNCAIRLITPPSSP
jgi:hypothetical protein